MEFNRETHVFRSEQFRSVVREAINFFDRSPMCKLPLKNNFSGTGVYALYYDQNELYLKRLNIQENKPIYVGKAVPRGWRTARSGSLNDNSLYRRIKEHENSINQARNLRLDDFQCRFIILEGIESDLIVPIEAELIRKYNPLWNCVVDGFGNHDPGNGRYNQARSDWDILHPGREWARKLHRPKKLGIKDKLKAIISQNNSNRPFS